jgi:hypothetical protein
MKNSSFSSLWEATMVYFLSTTEFLNVKFDFTDGEKYIVQPMLQDHLLKAAYA